MFTLKRKVETFLWRMGLIDDEYIFLRNISMLEEKDDNWCKRFWATRNVHGDMSKTAFIEYAKRINLNMNFTANDSILSMGCGDGILDKMLVDKFSIEKIYGFDFSKQKIRQAKNNNPIGVYWVQSFMDDIKFNKYDINKMYSFSVMQYCPSESIYDFFKNQIEFAVKQNNNEVIIYHGDVPDKNLAHNWYHMYRKDIVEKYKDKLRLIFNDNSYWHDMELTKKIIECICKEKRVNYFINITNKEDWYRSDIKIVIRK